MSAPAVTAQTTCPLCEGTGWKALAGSESDSRSHSPVRTVTRCDCVLRGRASSLLRSARIPKRYEHCTLESFDTFDEENLAFVKGVAEAFVHDYPLDKRGLLLVGDCGRGKTHLSVAIMRELIVQKSIACVFYDYRELLKEIQNSYNPSVAITELEVLRPVFRAEVLVLDDLGAVRPTDWVWDAVSLILNARYNESLCTIITTNYPDAREAGDEPPEQRAARRDTLGDRITERMRSRLHEMCKVVAIRGKDDYRYRVHARVAGAATANRLVSRFSLKKSRSIEE